MIRRIVVFALVFVALLAGTSIALTRGYTQASPADLVVQYIGFITPDPTFVPGEDIVIQIVISNEGGTGAESPTIRIIWPDDLEYDISSLISTPSDVWQVLDELNIVRDGVLPPGETDTLYLELRFPADVYYAFLQYDILDALTIEVTSSGPDANPDDNQDTVELPPSQIQAALRIDKKLINRGVAPGGYATYEVLVCNDGPSDVAGLSFTDIPGAHLLSDTLILIPETGDFYIRAHRCRGFMTQVQVDPDAVPGDLMVNTAQLDTSTVGWGGSTLPPLLTVEGVAETSDPVGDPALQANLRVVDFDILPDYARPGDKVMFRIDVANDGPAEAVMPIVTMRLDDVDFIVDGFWAYPFDTWHMSNGLTFARTSPMPVTPEGDVETLWVSLRLRSDAHYQVPRWDRMGGAWAWITSAQPDPEQWENQAFMWPLPARIEAELTIHKTLLNDSVAPGGTALYEISICNTGVSDVDGVEIKDVVGTNLDAATLRLSRGVDDLYVTAGGCVDVLATAQVPAEALPGEPFINAVTLITDTIKPGNTTLPPLIQLEQPTAVVTGTVGDLLPAANLEIVELQMVNPYAHPGGSVTYELQVINRGPAEAAMPVVTMQWANTDSIVDSFASDPPNAWQMSNGMTFVRRSPMPVGQVETLRVRLRLTSDAHYQVARTDLIGGIWTWITSVHPDPIQNGNRALLAPVPSRIHTRFTIEKTLLNDEVAPGGAALYAITICNDGISDVAGMAIVDVPGMNLAPNNLMLSADANDLYVAAGACVDVMASAKVVDTAVPGDLFVNTADLVTDTVLWGGTTVTPMLVLGESARVTGTVGHYLPSADIDVTGALSDVTSPIIAGAAYQFEVDITNHGPAMAQGVTVHDFLSDLPGWSVTEVETGAGWSCGGSLTCSRQDPMPVGTERVATFTVVLPPAAAPGVYQHTLAATADNPDGNWLNNHGFFAFEVTAEVTLSIEKDDLGVAMVAGGDPLQYIITVANAGPSDARNVVVTDTPLLGSWLWLEGDLEPGGWPMWCWEDGCTIARLPAGESVVIYATMRADPGLPPGDYEANAACIIDVDSTIATVNPPLPISNVEITEFVAIADVSVVKTAPGTANAGEELTYKIVVANAGPSDADELLLLDYMPSGTELIGMSESVLGGDLARYCTVNGTDVECDLDAYITGESTDDALAAGAELHILLLARVDTNIEPGTSLENVVTTAATTPDPERFNNFDTADTSILGIADLVLDKDGPTTATAGSEMTYTITVINHGPSTAQSVDVRDNLPVGVTLVSTEIARDGMAPALCGGTFCQLGDLEAGKAATITIVALTTSGLDYGTLLRNRATVFSTTPEIDLTNNSDYVDTMIVTMAALTMTKVDMPDPVVAGMVLDYEVTVMNHGPSDAFGVVVTDTVPTDTAFAGASAPCVENGGIIICDLGALASGREVRLTIQVRVGESVAEGVVIRNTAYAVAENAPRVTATTDTTVIQVSENPSDLMISKVGPAEISAFGWATYTLTITNNGPSPTNLVDIEDVLPDGLNLVRTTAVRSGTGSVSCVGTICRIPGMKVGEIATMTVVVEPCCGLKLGAVLTNTAIVNSDSQDPNTDNNQDSFTSRLPLFSTFLPVAVSSIAGGKPDLVVTKFEVVPTQVIYSTLDAVQIEVVVANQGGTPAGPFWVDLYINPDPIPSGANVLWQSTCTLIPCYGIAWTVPAGLQPGESVLLSSDSAIYDGQQSFWTGTFAPGTRDLYVYADSWNPDDPAVGSVLETNENNNSAYLAVTAGGASVDTEPAETFLHIHSRPAASRMD